MPAKSSLRDKKNKKLTDFFAQRPSSSAPPPSTSSSPAAAMSTTRKRPATRALTAAIGCESSMNSSAPSEMRSASTTATRKRAHSPDSDSSTFLLPSPKLKSLKKPTEMSKSYPHSKRLTPVVYVASPFRNPPARQPTPAQVHNNTLIASPSDSSKQVVCSSQSDEAELVLPIPEPRDLGNVLEDIHAWRQKTSEFFHSSSRVCEDAMEVDTPPSSPIHGSPVVSARSPSPHFGAPASSAAIPRSSVTFQIPVLACLSPLPDSNKLPPLPPTPEAIDPEAKTAKLIAAIKARAFAANETSDNEKPFAFRELEDSDDDLIDGLPLIRNGKEKSTLSPAPRLTSDMFSSPLSSVPSTFNDASIGRRSRRLPDHRSTLSRPTRSSSRARKPARAFRLPVTIAEPSVSTGETKSESFLPNRKRSHGTNPLRALLREKELLDKRGTSCAALRLAEEAIKEGSREASFDSDEVNTMNRPHLADEQAAWKAVHESRKSTSPVDPSGMEDFTIGDRESKMLGTVAGEAISKILAGDKTSKGKEKAHDMDQEMTSSVPLWIQFSDEDMEVDSMLIPPLSGHPILTCLDGFVRSGDDSLLDLIFRSGALAAVPSNILMCNIPQLLLMALFGSSQIADAVHIALRDLWGLNPQEAKMPFAAILWVLVRLGVNPAVLERLGLVTEHAQKSCVTHKTLLEALRRLLAIVKAAGLAGAFSCDDVANVVLILAIMGLDPLTSSELRMQLNVTIDVVCNHGTMDNFLHRIHEKITSFARQLVPINRARLVSFFASGSGQSRYIARRLAYCLLISVPNYPNGHAPPLEPLILLLSPDAGSCELFDVTNESTNYEELRHHVDILSMALIDIAPYVEEEHGIVKSANSIAVQGSPNKYKKPSMLPLELLRGALDSLQGKIVDTRAAHLDRSRMKAVIQRLMLRIHYDRMALIGVRPRRRASTLKAYFSPQRQ